MIKVWRAWREKREHERIARDILTQQIVEAMRHTPRERPRAAPPTPVPAPPPPEPPEPMHVYIPPPPAPSPESYVYFIRADTTGLIKIGVTHNPRKRLTALNTASPDGLTALGLIKGDRVQEQALHLRFAHYRKHGEWFEPGAELIAYIREKATPALDPEALERLLNPDQDGGGDVPQRLTDDEIYSAVAGEQSISIMRLQRRFHIGYTRARHIKTRLEQID